MTRNLACGGFVLSGGRPFILGIVIPDKRGDRLMYAHDVAAARDGPGVWQAVEDY